MLRDPAFWLAFIWLAAVPSFVLTGLLFHQIYLAEAKGVSLSRWTASYVLYAIFAVIGSLSIGQLIDQFSARKVAAHTLLPNSLACFALLFGPVGIGVPLFFIFFGLATGMPRHQRRTNRRGLRYSLLGRNQSHVSAGRGICFSAITDVNGLDD